MPTLRPDPNPRPALMIRLTHTGVLADGRPNTAPVLINDLDVGQEQQNRKVPCYVPVGGYLDIPASSRSLLSFEQGTIRKFHQVGVLTAQMFYAPERFDTVNRPSALSYPAGAYIWNETETAPNFADGGTWMSYAGSGPPAPHATSHQTGGNDPLSVAAATATNLSGATGLAVTTGAASPVVTDPGHTHTLTDPGHTHNVGSTTATNNSNTTSVTANSASANISVSDPGHNHTLTDPGHSHSVGSATATNNPIQLTIHETFHKIEQDNGTLGDITENEISASPSDTLGHPRTINVSFAANWLGGAVTVNGLDIYGTVVSETYHMPIGGGNVSGTKGFSSLTNFTNNITSAGNAKTTVKRGTYLQVASKPVTNFLRVCVDGTSTTFSDTDTTNGTFDATADHNGKTVEVWYTVSVVVTQNAHSHGSTTSSGTGATVDPKTTGISSTDAGHTHVLTDPGHTHTQAAHAHGATGASTTGASAASRVTGISVSDTGHTHSVSDPGHSHTQSPHTHNLAG